jgi:cobalt-zinc-cadmium efflux system protein
VHVGGDILALVIGSLASYLSFRSLGVRCLGLLMIVSAIVIAIEAFERRHGHHVSAPLLVLTVAALGAIGNWFQHHVLASGHTHDEISVGLDAHFLQDFWQSIGVILGAIIIYLTGWMLADLIISLAIAAWILYQGIRFLFGLIKPKEHPH